MKLKITYILLLLTIFCILPAEAQCAMCRAVLESEEGGQAAKGINNGIIYLMMIPYILVGTLIFVIYKTRQKAKEEES